MAQQLLRRLRFFKTAVHWVQLDPRAQLVPLALEEVTEHLVQRGRQVRKEWLVQRVRLALSALPDLRDLLVQRGRQVRKEWLGPVGPVGPAGPPGPSGPAGPGASFASGFTWLYDYPPFFNGFHSFTNDVLNFTPDRDVVAIISADAQLIAQYEPGTKFRCYSYVDLGNQTGAEKLVLWDRAEGGDPIFQPIHITNRFELKAGVPFSLKLNILANCQGIPGPDEQLTTVPYYSFYSSGIRFDRILIPK